MRRFPIRLLGFGFLCCLASSFGQTFYISLFNPGWREAFSLSHGQLGGIYSGATLLSGLSILQLGRLLDHVPLARYSAINASAFAIGCILLALAPSAGVLFFAFLLIRLTGQGLMGHIAISSMARFFDRDRGKAISIAALGFPLGEAVFPPLVVALLPAMGWRGLWWAAGLLIAGVLLPLLLWLPRGAPETDQAAVSRMDGVDRGTVLRDRRFWIVLPVLLSAPFSITGLFFHQATLADQKGWEMSLMAKAFLGFAILQLSSSLSTGWLIDRFGARNLMQLFPIPMGIGALLVAAFGETWVVFAYLALLGLTAGANGALSGALWAELYGTRHIGAIRALHTSAMVLSTAASPVLLGLLLDGGINMEQIAFGLGIAAVLVGPLLGHIVRGPHESSA